MTNFGARTQLELGPVQEDDAYLDVINIDWYDMIISMPFMRKHGLMLNFNMNSLSIQGKVVPTLTTGQEDLMLKKWAWCACIPVAGDGSLRCTMDWNPPGSAAPSQLNISHCLGKEKPTLKGGEGQQVQVMDTNKSQEPTLDIQTLQDWWFAEYADILNGVPPVLLPLREINHRIPLIDKNKRYNYHLPWCPNVIKPQFMEKLWMYVDARWWIPKAVS
jgi:hypothetical protein